MPTDENFIKYQSLGNDLIIFDWLNKSSDDMQTRVNNTNWKQFVVKLCDRHRGVGADGVLMIIPCQKGKWPEMVIFNADGERAENCLNGLRCVAHYLFTHHDFPKEFKIKVGSRINQCCVQFALPSASNDQNPWFLNETGDRYRIISHVGKTHDLKEQILSTSVGTFKGHEVHIGNPHFIVFKKTTLKWLEHHGNLLESHPQFPKHINVEFVWEKKEKPQGDIGKSYHVLIYERGCGITLACSSGAAAITGLLTEQGLIAKNQKIALCMPGGTVYAWSDTQGEIVLEADAKMVFQGSLPFEKGKCPTHT